MPINPSKVEKSNPSWKYPACEVQKVSRIFLWRYTVKESENCFEYSGVMHMAQRVHTCTLFRRQVLKSHDNFFYSSLSLLGRQLHYLRKQKLLCKQALRQRLVLELFYLTMGYRAFHVLVLHKVISALISSSKGLLLWHMSRCPADFPLF